MKGEFNLLMDLLSTASIYRITGGGYRFGGSEHDPSSALVSLVPCSNYRTKTLTVFVSSSLEVHLYTVIIPRNIGVIKDEMKGILLVALNKRLAEYGDSIKVISANGVHMQREGGVTNFCMGKTKIVSFKEGAIGTEANERSVFEVPYRTSLYRVSSDFFSCTKSLDNIFGFIHSLVPNVYAG